MTTVDEHAARAVPWRQALPVVASVALVGAIYGVFQSGPASSNVLTFDLGVQFHLSRFVAEGAVPIRDFEHPWNAGGWYVGAALHRLLGGDPTLWVLVWSVLGGAVLTAVLNTAIALRAGVSAVVAVLAAVTTVLFASVPNAKYSIPAICTLVLAWAIVQRRSRFLTTAAVLCGVVFWLHVELAVLTGFGLVLWAFLGDGRRIHVRPAVEAGLAVAGGLAVGLVIELLALEAVGVSAGDFLDSYVLSPSDASNPARFGWDLTDPINAQAALLPLLTLGPFVPLVYRRLHPVTRLVCCVDLAMVTVALNRVDAPHLRAAMAMVPLAMCLVGADLHRSGFRLGSALRRPWSSGQVVAVAAGATATTLVVVAAVEVRSLLVLALLGSAVSAGIFVARAVSTRALSVGSIVALVGIGLFSTAAHEVSELRRVEPYSLYDQVAAAVSDDLDRCAGGSDDVLVITQKYPLLNQTLGVDNPSPYYTFWYGTNDRKVPTIVDLVERGEIDAIVTMPALPESASDLRPVLETRFEICHEQQFGDTPLTIYRYVTAS